MLRLVDMVDSDRMVLRADIESAGGQIDGYDVDSFQVALPNPTAPFFAAIDRHPRLQIVPASIHHFPTGSDCNWMPENLKHDGRYPGSRGFWLYARVRVTF